LPECAGGAALAPKAVNQQNKQQQGSEADRITSSFHANSLLDRGIEAQSGSAGE